MRSDVLEVRPGTVRAEDLAVFERVLEQTPSHLGGTPCLVGPDGMRVELPADPHALQVSIIENLKVEDLGLHNQ